MADHRDKVIQALEKVGNGSFLRGWRRELDPEGSLSVTFLDFCKACQRLRLHDIDASALFGSQSPGEMTLEHLHPSVGRFVNRFRKWMTEHFGGPSEMYAAFESSDTNDGKLSKKDFVAGCLEQGFSSEPADIEEVFNLLDANGTAALAMEDVMFLDLDSRTRQGAIAKAKMKARRRHELLLTNMHNDLKAKGYPESHRLASRAWHAPVLDRLPEVALERRHLREDRHKMKMVEVFQLFNRHLIKSYGNGIRAWRKGLDPKSTFACSRAHFLQYCRKLDLGFDYNLLWRVLDRDGDGVLRLEEVAPKAGSALARFWKWARTVYFTCEAAWPHIMEAARPPPSWKSITSLKFSTFLAAIKGMGFDGALEPGVGLSLCQGLDLDGCGIISLSDLRWLDGWKPPEWLVCSPDKEAWLELSKRLLKRYRMPLNAWRQMDMDDSNSTSWVEFEMICEAVKFNGNRGGAWRYLDRDVSGTITMHEWHQESANVLHSFKEFLDKEYGSIKLAFEGIDTDNSGSVTYSELKRACKRRGWTGDVKMIFDCLNIRIVPGIRSLAYKDVAFLETWQPSLHPLLDELSEDPAFAMSLSAQRAGLRTALKRSASAQGRISSPPRMLGDGSNNAKNNDANVCEGRRGLEQTAPAPTAATATAATAASIAVPQPQTASSPSNNNSNDDNNNTINNYTANNTNNSTSNSNSNVVRARTRPQSAGRGAARRRPNSASNSRRRALPEYEYLLEQEPGREVFRLTGSEYRSCCWCSSGRPQKDAGVGFQRKPTIESMKAELVNLKRLQWALEDEHKRHLPASQVQGTRETIMSCPRSPDSKRVSRRSLHSAPPFRRGPHPVPLRHPTRDCNA